MNIANSILPQMSGLVEGMSPEQGLRILGLMTCHRVSRGETLTRAGEATDRLDVILHGRFASVLVEAGGASGALRMIDAEGLIGVTAFLSGRPARHTVTALRDSAVLRLERSALDQLAEECPKTFAALLQRLMREAHDAVKPARATPAAGNRRIITFVQAAGEAVPPGFWSAMRQSLEQAGARVLDAADLRRQFGARPLDAVQVAETLNRQANASGPLVCLTDPDLTLWTEQAIRQADEVVLVTRGPAPLSGHSDVERCVSDLHIAAQRRLVRVHDRRVCATTGTAAWLARIDCFMNHHVSLQDQADMQSLSRFLTNRAIGFVASGGGALGAAHVGVFRAFAEADVTFDIFGGTSVGAAMLAGFCRLEDAERLDLGAHRIFVQGKSFKRFNVPKYGLLDHQNFDRALQREYGEDTLIEDCWRPFFAVASNLSTKSPEIIRRGVMWKAVRASSAIPGMLPPFYTSDGMMLVDGGIMQNVPIDAMRGLKNGPNVLVHFNTAAARRFPVDYDALPGRGRLLAGLLNPWAQLPRAPSATAVLWRSLLVHQKADLELATEDLELCPPRTPGAGVFDFSKHRQVYLASYAWAKAEIAARNEAGDTPLSAILAATHIGL
ncbi:patatin-like phospholipase family protein [Roseinatronobacter sp. NSM]|uniref:patatin-like phospholipase family protein n=1 Tax=Roseinatronobacter sp. NSM TaxID=3457785 RepID=UPI0040370101